MLLNRKTKRAIERARASTTHQKYRYEIQVDCNKCVSQMYLARLSKKRTTSTKQKQHQRRRQMTLSLKNGAIDRINSKIISHKTHSNSVYFYYNILYSGREFRI